MQNESQNIEYKESWRDEYLKWICGFANAQGGRIYIGVNDQKEVIGLSDAKRLLEDIPNKIVRSIELWNYGLLPKELTPAALLQKHSSYPRNHNIANVFYKAGFVESWGRGFKKIAEEFERASKNSKGLLCSNSLWRRWDIHGMIFLFMGQLLMT